MLPTLENALERISKLESRIAQLEKMLISRNEPAHIPPTSAQPIQPSSNSEIAFPRLNAELMEQSAPKAAIEAHIKSAQLQTMHATSALETSYPNIADNITLVWGSPECETYLNKLMLNSRGDRQGFNLDIMSELMLLTAITEREQADIWVAAVQIGDRR